MNTDELQKKIKQIPQAPGIYQMLDINNKIVYIGKSKCLKKRVASYFVPEPKWEKAKKMAPYIKDIEYIVTDTHLDAMLLECERIKKIRPYFNVLMKNEQKYVYLVLEKDCRKNPLSISYIKTDHTIGLLRSKGRLEEFIEGMRHLYPLKKRRNGTYIIDYHMLPTKMSQKEFEKNRYVLDELCQKPSLIELFITQLEDAMKQASKKMNFEYALKYRDLIEHVRYLENHLLTYQKLMGKDILYSVPLADGYKLYYIRYGLVFYSKAVSTELEKQTKQFLNDIYEHKLDNIIHYSEKESIDYRSIVYTELAAADESAITYLESN